MSNIVVNKNRKPVVTVDYSIKGIGDDPAVKEKAQKAEAFLKKHGVPDTMSKKSK